VSKHKPKFDKKNRTVTLSYGDDPIALEALRRYAQGVNNVDNELFEEAWGEVTKVEEELYGSPQQIEQELFTDKPIINPKEKSMKSLEVLRKFCKYPFSLKFEQVFSGKAHTYVIRNEQGDIIADIFNKDGSQTVAKLMKNSPLMFEMLTKRLEALYKNKSRSVGDQAELQQIEELIKLIDE